MRAAGALASWVAALRHASYVLARWPTLIGQIGAARARRSHTSGAARVAGAIEVLAQRRDNIGARPPGAGEFEVRARGSIALRVRCMCRPSAALLHPTHRVSFALVRRLSPLW